MKWTLLLWTCFFLAFNTTHKFDAFHFQILIIVVCCQFFSVTVWLNNVQICAPPILMWANLKYWLELYSWKTQLHGEDARNTRANIKYFAQNPTSQCVAQRPACSALFRRVGRCLCHQILVVVRLSVLQSTPWSPTIGQLRCSSWGLSQF